MLKESQAQDRVRETDRMHYEKKKEHIAASRHAGELEAIRSELRDWQTKRAELERSNKDPDNQAGKVTEIA